MTPRWGMSCASAPRPTPNDPYVYFNAESLLATHGIRVNADEYRYMVVLVRARAGNRNGT